MAADSSGSLHPHPVVTWGAGVLGIASIGVIDYASGVEIRIFPLYYAPLAFLAWRFGRSGALVATGLSGASWAGSNILAGLEYSLSGTWAFNTVMQTVSFATVGLLIAVVRDALDRERSAGRRDPLTGILNRKGFYEEAAGLMALCRRTGRPITVAYIDLDNFKAANDQLGHDIGDSVLRTTADLLRVAIRPSDVAGRLGGDEFVILFPELGAAEAAIVLERIRASVTDTFASGRVRITCSVGAVSFEAVPEQLDDLVRLADVEMYRAKAAGRNRIQLRRVGNQPVGSGAQPSID